MGYVPGARAQVTRRYGCETVPLAENFSNGLAIVATPTATRPKTPVVMYQ